MDLIWGLYDKIKDKQYQTNRSKHPRFSSQVSWLKVPAVTEVEAKKRDMTLTEFWVEIVALF